MRPTHIRKRSGDIVPFDAAKIQAALEKAMHAVLGERRTDDVTALVDGVEARLGVLTHAEERVPSVEEVQDLVEQALMDAKFFDVAKAYILYRAAHASERAEARRETAAKLAAEGVSVARADGTRDTWTLSRIAALFAEAAEGLPGVDVVGLAAQCRTSLYDGMSEREFAAATILSCRAFMERDAAYDAVAGYLFTTQLLGEAAAAVGESISTAALPDDLYRRTFVRGLARSVDIGRLVPELLTFDLPALALALKPERDRQFGYRGLQTLYDRYFVQDDAGKRLETPQGFFMRVAMGLALNEERKDAKALEFYEAMSSFRYLPSTPTLFHAGTLRPQLSSCYLTTVEDDLTHIFKAIGDNAQLSKWSGGLGNDWTNVRAMGARIKSTNVESQGVIPFLKIANDTTVAINRSGKRRGATCAYLETWHLDIEDFLELRKNTGDERRRTHDMNTANWIPDLFMERVITDGPWTLFSPNDVSDLHHTYGRAFRERYEAYEEAVARGEISLYRTVRAKDLWRKMVTMLFETGHPWITFKDPCNIRSPQDHVGVVHNSNLCTEITLNTSAEETAVCNLGSVNLPRHIVDGALDEALLAATVKVALRMLDNVVDINFYPTPEAKASNLRHRPVGLGVMGFQDALYLLRMPFDSEAASAFADESMELIAYHAYLASSMLARERGAYASYKGSKWDRGLFPQDTIALLERERGMAVEVPRGGKLDWTPVRNAVRKHGMRNSNCIAIAPTATISNIAGCFPCIEPIYKNLYVKSNMSGEFTVVNAYLAEDLKRLGLWDANTLEVLKYRDGSVQGIEGIPEDVQALYKETFEIEPEWIIRHAARRSKWIDQSQSVNLFYRGTSGKRIADLYVTAWKAGLKTTYYLRTLAASGIEKSTLDINKWKEERQAEQTSERREPVPVVAVYKSEDTLICEACQ